jgi:hypothetical protein
MVSSDDSSEASSDDDLDNFGLDDEFNGLSLEIPLDQNHARWFPDVNDGGIEDDLLDDYAPDTTIEVPTRMPLMTEVYGITGNHASLSSEDAIKCLWNPWVTFCTSRERIPYFPTTGLSFYYSVEHGVPVGTDRLDILVRHGSELRIDFNTMNAFFVFQAEKPDMTSSQFDKSAKFIRAHVTAECNALKHRAGVDKIPLNIEDPAKKVSAAGSPSCFKKLMEQVKKRKAAREKRNGTDLQADKERLITNVQRMQLIKEVFHPTDVSVLTIAYLSLLGFLAQFNKAFMIGKRGEALRSHTFGMTYAESYRLGPDSNLMTSFVLSNKGKENKVGRRTCTGFVPHYQPSFDATGSDGLLFIFRFGGRSRCDFALAERLPNFLDPKDLLNNHIYTSVNGGARVEIPRSTYQTTWGTMLKACNVIADKVTHQPRKQVQQELDFKLCPPELITRFLGYSVAGKGNGNNNQNQSYLTNQHVGVMSSVAGSPYGHLRPETHSPGYYLTNSDDLMPALFEKAGLGSFLTQRQAVFDEFNKYTSKKVLAKKGLFMAEGSVSYFFEAVKRAFLVAAARPLHADSGRLNRDSQRIYEL